MFEAFLDRNPRFAIARRLGAGGMGTVYEAYDREREITVALKTLRHLDPAALYRFKQEFRALAHLSHPNLVALHELLVVDDQWFFTMELIHGVDFLSYVRAAAAPAEPPPESRPALAVASPRASAAAVTHTVETMATPPKLARPEVPPADLDRLRAALPALAGAIAAIHASGHLHRDIKPGNVLVTTAGRVVVLDFGIITSLDDKTPNADDGHFVGTPAYMAPEQLEPGYEPAAASDWYAVGVMLFEALTGRRPFEGRSQAMLEAKRATDAPSPRAYREDADPVLADLCERLLARDPAARPSGAEVLRVLGGVNAAPARAAADDTALLGREQQLAALRTAFEQTRDGAGATVHIHGYSGMGKSALAARFLDELRQRDRALVLAGRCYERESVPYEAIDSLVDALCQALLELPRPVADALMPLDVTSLARVFPVLRRVEAVAQAKRRSATMIHDPQELRRKAFAALRELLARLAEQRALVLFIDDLQWGDPDSAAFLASLMDPPTPPLLLVLSYRSEAIETSALLRDLLAPERARGAGGAAVHQVPVNRLPLPKAQALAETLLAGHESAAATADKIARESQGNPYFIHELVRFATSSAGSGKSIDLELGELIRARAAALTPEARYLLELVAVAGKPIAQAVARRAADLGSAFPVALAELRTAHMVRTSGVREYDVVECYHDRIRETVAGAVAEDEAPALHLRLARGIESSARPDAESLAVHFAAAGEREAAHEHAVAAADAAADALAFERAATFYELALRFVPEGATATISALARKLGDALVNAGRGADGAEAYLRAAETDDGGARLHLQVRAGGELLRSGRVDAGLEVLRPALAGAGLTLAATPLLAVLSLLLRRAYTRLRGLGFRERGQAEIRPQELTLIDAFWAASSAFGMADTLRGADIQTRHLLAALRTGDLVRIGRALAYEGAYASLPGPTSRRRTDKILGTVRDIAERTGEPLLLGTQRVVAALAAYQFGEWQRCNQFAGEAQLILREQCKGATWELSSAQLYQVWSLWWAGELGAMTTQIRTFLKEARERGDVYTVVNLTTGLPSISELVADDPEGGRARAEQARGQWSRQSRQGFHLQHYWTQLTLTQCELYAGQGAEAHARAVLLWGTLRRMFLLGIGMVRCEMLQLRARAALVAAAAPGADREAMLRAARRDARRLGREKIAWCRPAALVLEAALEVARGRREPAIALLERGAAGLEATGTRAFAVAANLQRGRLVGGAAGDALVAEASAWLERQTVRHPGRMADFLAPGFATR